MNRMSVEATQKVNGGSIAYVCNGCHRWFFTRKAALKHWTRKHNYGFRAVKY